MRTAVVNIGQLATLAGPIRLRRGAQMREIGLRSNAGILIENGRIWAVGDSPEIARHHADETIDAGGRLVTPGFIDAHTHVVFGGNRANEFEMRSQGATYQEIAAVGGGILSSVRATRAATSEELDSNARTHMKWCRSLGTTTIEFKSGYGLDFATEQEMLETGHRVGRELGMRTVGTFLGAHAVPPEAADRESYMNEVLQWARRIEGAKFVDIFVEDRYFSAEDARRLVECGKPMRMHVDQMGDRGGAALAAELGAATADHLEHTSSAGIDALAASNTIPVLLPSSVFGLRLTKYPDARQMIDKGLPVVVATDFNPGSSPSPSLPFAMSLAMTQMGMDAAECLTAVTVNAAESLGHHTTGTIEPGMQADLLIHEVGDYREIPYWIGAPLVRDVLIAGRRCGGDGDLV